MMHQFSLVFCTFIFVTFLATVVDAHKCHRRPKCHRHTKQTCPPPDPCEGIECGPYSKCINGCQPCAPSCENVHPVCIAMCVNVTTHCVCNDGYLNGPEGKCIRESECPLPTCEGNKCGKNETCSVCEPCYPSPSCEQPSGGVCTEECRRVGSQHFCSCAPEYVTGPEGNCILENDCPNKTGSPTSTTIPPTFCANRVIHYHGAKAAEPSIVFEDFDNTESYYKQYRPPTVNCTCAADSTLSRHYYRKELMIQYRGENESHPDPSVALNVTCGGGWWNLCVCTESGNCYHAQNQVDYPVFLRLYPFCELGNKEECHVYAEVEGSGVISINNQSDRYSANSAKGPLGVKSSYLKVVSLSCNDCEKIASTTCD